MKSETTRQALIAVVLALTQSATCDGQAINFTISGPPDVHATRSKQRNDLLSLKAQRRARKGKL